MILIHEAPDFCRFLLEKAALMKLLVIEAVTGRPCLFALQICSKEVDLKFCANYTKGTFTAKVQLSQSMRIKLCEGQSVIGIKMLLWRLEFCRINKIYSSKWQPQQSHVTSFYYIIL